MSVPGYQAADWRLAGIIRAAAAQRECGRRPGTGFQKLLAIQPMPGDETAGSENWWRFQNGKNRKADISP
jgi:hypothetical protein